MATLSGAFQMSGTVFLVLSALTGLPEVGRRGAYLAHAAGVAVLVVLAWRYLPIGGKFTDDEAAEGKVVGDAAAPEADVGQEAAAAGRGDVQAAAAAAVTAAAAAAEAEEVEGNVGQEATAAERGQTQAAAAAAAGGAGARGRGETQAAAAASATNTLGENQTVPEAGATSAGTESMQDVGVAVVDVIIKDDRDHPSITTAAKSAPTRGELMMSAEYLGLITWFSIIVVGRCSLTR